MRFLKFRSVLLVVFIILGVFLVLGQNSSEVAPMEVMPGTRIVGLSRTPITAGGVSGSIIEDADGVQTLYINALSDGQIMHYPVHKMDSEAIDADSISFFDVTPSFRTEDSFGVNVDIIVGHTAYSTQIQIEDEDVTVFAQVDAVDGIFYKFEYDEQVPEVVLMQHILDGGAFRLTQMCTNPDQPERSDYPCSSDTVPLVDNHDDTQFVIYDSSLNYFIEAVEDVVEAVSVEQAIQLLADDQPVSLTLVCSDFRITRQLKDDSAAVVFDTYLHADCADGTQIEIGTNGFFRIAMPIMQPPEPTPLEIEVWDKFEGGIPAGYTLHEVLVDNVNSTNHYATVLSDNSELQLWNLFELAENTVPLHVDPEGYKFVAALSMENGVTGVYQDATGFKLAILRWQHQ